MLRNSQASDHTIGRDQSGNLVGAERLVAKLANESPDHASMFSRTEEQVLLADAVDAFLRDSGHRRGKGFDQALWNRAATELGLLTAIFPESHGGAGGTFSDAAVVMECLGQHDAGLPYLEAVIMAGMCVVGSGHSSAPAMAGAISSGDMLLVPAWRDASESKCTAYKAEGGAYRIVGEKRSVRWADDATHFLVSGQIDGDASRLALFVVSVATEGLSFAAAKSVDGVSCADLVIDCIVTGDALMVEPERGWQALEDMILRGEVALCAESLGLMRTMMARTLAHLRQRQQFGASLISFQILQHRLVDLRLALEFATSATIAAVYAIDVGSPERGVLVAAANHVTMGALEKVAQETVQLHGAIGLMAETEVSHFFRRALVVRSQLLGRHHHLNLLSDRAGATVPGTSDDDDLLGVLRGASEAQLRFRREVVNFIEAELRPDIVAGSVWESGSFGRPDLTIPWLQALNNRGWAAPGWPIEHGGCGWTARERQIFEEEIARRGAPRLPAMGLSMIGPVLLRFGTPEQKAHFLPRILSGEDYWCQGFSEPGAGSDLASLRLSALREKDEYILDGSKIWTTHAHHANWMFLLARTAKMDRKQQGVSFLMVKLDTPGITIRPLTSMSGDHEVNEVFFDQVRVPVANLVGEEHEGWAVARYLLEFERGVGHQVQALATELSRLREIATGEKLPDGTPLWCDPAFRRRYADLEARTLAIRLTEERLVYALPAGRAVGDFTAGLMKLAWSEMGQEIGEAMIDALGPLAAYDQAAACDHRDASRTHGPAYAATPTRRYLDERGMTIAGGSSEVLRTVLAKLILSDRA